MSARALGTVQAKQPNPETIKVLTEIWQRVLQRTAIGPAEKFYAIGGTDALADRLFAEIVTVFKRQIPTATICHAPTISALAALLEQPVLPHFSPFVPLKAGSHGPPVLIAHGIGGRASFSALAEHLRIENPVYGIQAKGVDGMEEPLGTIEEMAQFYLDALREIQADGPHLLIGYSFGGLIALEMAQRLSERGKRVALLALVDTYPHPRYLPLNERLVLGAKRIHGHLLGPKRMTLGKAFARALYLFRRRVGDSRTRPQIQGFDRFTFAQTTEYVKEINFLAMRRYRPLFFRGKIRFVRPERNAYLPTDPAVIWKQLAQEFEVETVPGDHLGMIGAHFESLASTLTRYVRDASTG